MGSPFSGLRSPTRWTQISREFPHGSHYLEVTKRLFAVVMLAVNDGVRELDVRYMPLLGMNGRPNASKRTLKITCRHIVRKHLTVTFDATGVQIGDNYIPINKEGGVMRLVHALVDEVERTWNGHGR